MTLCGRVRYPRVAAIRRPRPLVSETQMRAMRSGGTIYYAVVLGRTQSEAAMEAAAALEALPERWRRSGCDAQRAYSEWNHCAEAYLFAAATGEGTLPSALSGRGAQTQVTWRTLRPKVDKASGTDIGARAARWAALGRRLLRLAVGMAN